MKQADQKIFFFNKINWIIIGGWFGLFYWIIESVRDVILFEKGPFLQRLFFPDPMSFWMRILVVFILMLFGAFAQFRKDRFIDSKRLFYKKKSKQNSANLHIMLTGFIFGFSYWIIESVRFTLLTSHGTIITNLTPENSIVFWSRILPVFIIILFSIDAQMQLNKLKQTNEDHIESEERLRQIVRQMPYAIIVCKRDGTITKINQALIDFLGLGPESAIIGKSNLKTDPLIIKLGLQNEFEKALLGETVLIPEAVIPVNMVNKKYNIRTGDSICLEVTFFPVFKKNGDIWRIVTIWKDLTSQKREKQEKEDIQAQLMQSQKMEAVGMLAGGIAHDFNNMLTAIIGGAEIAMMSMDDPETLKADLLEIKKSAERAAKLTAQLLLFSRKEQMSVSPVNLNETIKNLMTMLQRVIGEDITISTRLTETDWTIQSDLSTLEQIIMNMAVNARDAMPQGGRLNISTENIILDQKICREIFQSRPGQYIRLSIKDTGSGMDKETIHKIFEPFFSTKAKGCGTGLGLSVVYNIMLQHKGWINVESKPEIGTVFHIYFPATDEQQQTKPPEQDEAAKVSGNNERLLVVEDDDNVRNYTARVLIKNGYQVFTAKNAVEAHSIFKAESGDFHMLMCDVVLPGKTGIILAGEFIRKNPSLKVLMCSGYLDQKSQRSVIKEKGFRFIRKPYQMNDLVSMINETISTENLNA